MNSKTDELRKVRYEHRKVAYTVGELNTKIKREPNRTDLKAMREELLAELNRYDLRRFQLLAEIKASPYALADVVEVIDALTNIQSQIAFGGAEEGQLAVGAFLRYLTTDKERITHLQEGEEIEVTLPTVTGAQKFAEQRKRAKVQQEIIDRQKAEISDLKIKILKAELSAAKAQLAGATK